MAIKRPCDCGTPFQVHDTSHPECSAIDRKIEEFNELPMTTSSTVPGREIEKILGLVFGAGNAAWTIETTADRSGTALRKASNALMAEANRLGANAVVSVLFSMDSSGSSVNRSQAITLLGTAVKLKD